MSGPCSFLDGLEKRVGFDEIISGIGSTPTDLCVIHFFCARWTEKISDRDFERVGDSPNNVDGYVAGTAFNPGDSRSRKSSFLRELLLRKPGSGSPDDDIDA